MERNERREEGRAEGRSERVWARGPTLQAADTYVGPKIIDYWIRLSDGLYDGVSAQVARG